MSRSPLYLLLILLAAACSEEAPPKKQAVTVDAAPQIAIADAGALPLPAFDPLRTEPAGRTIEILLESSPPGAHVAVDGLSLGATPIIWRGIADGKAHDFSFELAGHLNSNYRFIPIQNGVVHGTLQPAAKKDTDAGAAASAQSK